MTLVHPIVAWGAAEAIAGGTWGSIGTPVVTGSQADPFGGTDAVLVEDDDGAVGEARTYSTLTVSAVLPVLSVCISEGTAGVTEFALYDITATTFRHQVRATWAGGVPTLSTVSGGGTLFTPLSIGAGFYLCMFTATGVVTANTHRIYLYPAGATAANTGTTTFYIRNIAVLGLVDTVTAYDQPMDGYTTARNTAGVEDAWVPGTDYMLGFDLRFIGKAPADNPVLVSGWDGANDFTGVNASVGAMLRAGRDKVDLLWVPDRSDCSDYITSKLAAPLKGAPQLEQDGRRRQRVQLRNATTEYAGYA